MYASGALFALGAIEDRIRGILAHCSQLLCTVKVEQWELVVGC